MTSNSSANNLVLYDSTMQVDAGNLTQRRKVIETEDEVTYAMPYKRKDTGNSGLNRT